MPTALLEISAAGAIAHVRMARPEVRNAFNADLVTQLGETFSRMSDERAIRAIVLSGSGKAFCGGADISWMRDSLALSKEENALEAQRMSDMFRTINRCSKPVIGQIHGAALGGGAGLAAVCDVVVASAETVFGFTETKLGILPAVISPFVLAKIGQSHARALFLTGERFNAVRAAIIGLVHEVVGLGELEAAVKRITDEILSASPTAIALAKKTIADVSAASLNATRDITAQAIAYQRISEEGQEGLRAFLERRTPKWAP